MKHPLSLYDFNNNDIRVIEIDGEPWFVAKDVCDVLALNNPSQAVKANCKECNHVSILKSNLISNEVSFANRGMSCVNEAGLYELIFASRKPEARAFQKWVTSVVLPAIRKDGMYVAGEEKMAIGEIDEDELVLMVMENLRKKIARTKEKKRSMRKVL
jgi:prophage antirepressor-like protein